MKLYSTKRFQRGADHQLKNLVGSASIPILVVGANVQKGFEPGAYNSALDAGGYPRAGIRRPRNQAEPKQPPPDSEPQAAREEQAEETPAPRGPYSPR